MYSNAISDKRSSGNQAADEANVRTFYERSPYPDLGAGLKDPSGWLRVLRNVKPLANEGKYLDAGCGTGHVMCGLARELTSWSATGIDLSAPSLMIARQLGEKYQLSNISWVKRSYLDDLSDLGKFDVIGCH